MSFSKYNQVKEKYAIKLWLKIHQQEIHRFFLRIWLQYWFWCQWRGLLGHVERQRNQKHKETLCWQGYSWVASLQQKCREKSRKSKTRDRVTKYSWPLACCDLDRTNRDWSRPHDYNPRLCEWWFFVRTVGNESKAWPIYQWKRSSTYHQLISKVIEWCPWEKGYPSRSQREKRLAPFP